MRLKKLKKSKYQLLELRILKKFYKKKKFTVKTHIKQTEILLNKIANIIYHFHTTNKKILFIGFPTTFSNTLKNTKHLLIPQFFWFDGMLSNKISLEKNNEEKAKIPRNVLKLILKLKKKSDLVIIYNLKNNLTAINESHSARIPLITIYEKLNISNRKSTYKSTGSYNFLNEKLKNTELIFSFIKTVLIKAIKIKRTKRLFTQSIINNSGYLSTNRRKKI